MEKKFNDLENSQYPIRAIWFWLSFKIWLFRNPIIQYDNKYLEIKRVNQRQ